MRVEVVAIGDEILGGITVNTNATFISKALHEIGWEAQRHTVLSDEPKALKEGLIEALDRSSIVISTGGLGPTFDDLTRNIAAELFGSGFHFDEKVAADLERRFGKELSSLEDQATVPSKADVLINRVGTAPGLIFREGKKLLALMPGIPQEMQPMFVEQILPYLKNAFGESKKIHSELVHFCLLPESRIDPILRELKPSYPHIHVGIYPSYGTASVHISGTDPKEIAAFKERLVRAFPTHVFSAKSGKIEEVVHHLFSTRKMTLALAESCTGGMMAERLTSFAGASDYFLGSLVVYSNKLKEDLLGVSAKTLREKGAVSAETVEEMLSGLFKTTGADWGIAVSGIAGPTGGTPDKPVGTIWAAIGQRGHPPDVATFFGKGNRQTIILMAANRLLAYLWQKIVHNQRFAP